MIITPVSIPDDERVHRTTTDMPVGAKLPPKAPRFPRPGTLVFTDPTPALLFACSHVIAWPDGCSVTANDDALSALEVGDTCLLLAVSPFPGASTSYARVFVSRLQRICWVRLDSLGEV